MTSENDNLTQLKTPKAESYYRKADRNTHLLSADTFDLRFPQIKNSATGGGMCSTIKLGSKFLFGGYTNLGHPTDLTKLEQQLPIQTPTFPSQQNKITYTWIGHSTAVISFGKDANFLIDPVFSQRCSPVQWAGPKRYRPLPCTIKQLPTIDAVLVSHDHYDHLDQEALTNLYDRFPESYFMAGINSEDVLPKKSKMITFDWTQTKDININGKIFKVTFVPACHWGARGPFDKFKRLWGGFVIEAPNKQKVFYSGDTAYCSIFKELGQVFGGFDLSILPIGAYEPRQLLKPQHVNPDESVQVHLDIKSKKSVGVHWGTFPLGFEHYLQPRKDLAESLQKRRIDTSDFITIDHGAHFQIDYTV